MIDWLRGFDFGVDRLVIGVFTGLTYGLLAVGLVLVYRSSRFVNFAHGSIGVFGASVLGLLVVDWGAPYWLAFPVAIVVAGALAAGVEVAVVRRLAGRPALIGMIATLGLSQFILVLALLINTDGVSGFTFPEPAGLPTDWKIGTLPFGPPYIAMLLFAPILLVGLSPVPHEPPGRHRDAGRVGRHRHRTARGHPGQADDHAGLGDRRRHRGVLGDPGDTRRPPGQSIETLGPDLLLKGLAGAVIARMSSIPIAVAASIGIGVLEQVLLSNPDTRGLVSVVIGAIDRDRPAAPAGARPGRPRAGQLAPRRRRRRCPRPTARCAASAGCRGCCSPS